MKGLPALNKMGLCQLKMIVLVGDLHTKTMDTTCTATDSDSVHRTARSCSLPACIKKIDNKKGERERSKCTPETAEQKELRLENMKANDRKRRERSSPEQASYRYRDSMHKESHECNGEIS